MQSPRDLGLPYPDWRPGQRLAIRTALHPKTKHVVIQSPTGSGKSTIAAALLKLDARRGVVLTATKGLEDQYSAAIPSMYDIRGMGNYECLAARKEFVELFRNRRDAISCEDGPCRSGYTCGMKDNGCTYFDRVRGAMATTELLTNYKYHLAMRRYGKGLGFFNRIVCDEAHALPEELMSSNQIQIPIGMLDGNPPKAYKQWRQWAASRLEELAPKGDGPTDGRHRRQRLVDSLERLAGIDETWAWDTTEHHVVFEPTIPRLLLPSLADMGNPAQKIVYLSATITPATLDVLGIPRSDVTFKVMSSRFDPAHRPVYVVKTVRVRYDWNYDDIAYWHLRINQIVEPRRDRKALIHSISYDRAWIILKGAQPAVRKRMIIPKRGEVAETVAMFKRLPQSSGAILVSPSVMTGFDFPYTDAEYQIIVKTPYPDTRSAIAKARVEATPGYRDHITSQSLQQAVGRIVRAEDDRGETFIIDDLAQYFIRGAAQKQLLSASFLDAVQYVTTVPAPPPRLTMAA